MPSAPEFNTSETFAFELDERDPLGSYPQHFHHPLDLDGKPAIYLCGNSLGPQPRSTQAYQQQVMDQWRDLGVRGHFSGQQPWTLFARQLIPLLAPILGAEQVEVVPMGTLTENIHLLLAAFYRPSGQRTKILTIGNGFPSDRYALESMLALRGLEPKEHLIFATPKKGEFLFEPEQMIDMIKANGPELALVFLPAVHFASGQAFNLEHITQTARDQGCLVGFDLAHAAGNIPLHLHTWGVDFAAWCGYKYLCSGPGNGSGIYVHSRHAQRPDLLHLAGWWGNSLDNRFEMRPHYEPLLTAERFQVSNPAILPLACLQAALELYLSAGLERIWEKSRLMTSYLEYLLRTIKPEMRSGSQTSHFRILTPSNPAERGNQLSILVEGNAVEIAEALLEAGVVIDERPPRIIRVAPMPLFNRYHEVWQFVQKFRRIMLTLHDRPLQN